ncbi:MAG: cyclic nucleotide-binding domain-containing protein [Bacteroidota bacterium]|nr:cyclic nucleotide-binding domain-containing protein [Bacteroidota bacterium]
MIREIITPDRKQQSLFHACNFGGMEELLAFLNSVFPLSDALTEHLSLTVKVRELRKKEILLRAGHICRDIHFIARGLLRCYYEKGEQEVCSWFMKEGDVIVSIESFFERKVSYESIQALEDCVLFYINYDELYHIYQTYPEFNWISRELTQHYYILWAKQLYGLRMQSAQERYDWLLANFPELALRVPAKYVASWLGINEAHFSVVKGRK